MSEEDTKETLEEKEEKGFLDTVDPQFLKFVTVGGLLIVFYLHFFTETSLKVKMAVVGVAVLLIVINSKQAAIENKELTCEESVEALEKHIHWWRKRDDKYKYFEIFPDADVTDINDRPRFWLHTILFKKKIGQASVDQWYLGKTEAFSPAKPRLFFFGRRPNADDLLIIKEYLLNPKIEAISKKGLLKGDFVRDIIGGR